MPTTFSFEEKIRQDILLFSIRDDFFGDIEKIQEKYNLPLKGDECEDEVFDFDWKNFDKDFYKITEKYRIPESHEIALQTYIRVGKLEKDVSIGSDLWHLNPDIETGDKKHCVNLKLYPDTTLEDIQKNWPRIKKARDEILNIPIKKKDQFKNLDRDIEILRLSKEGKTGKEIIDILKNKEEYDVGLLTYNEIPGIIKRIKDRSDRLITY